MSTDDTPEWARVLIDAAPPLTTEQVDAIRPAFAHRRDLHEVDARDRESERPETSAA